MGVRTSREDLTERWVRNFQTTKGGDPQMHCPVAHTEGYQFHRYNPDAVHPLQARIAEQLRINDELRWKTKAPEPSEPTVLEIHASGRKPQPKPEYVDNAAYFALPPPAAGASVEVYARSAQRQPSHVCFVKEGGGGAVPDGSDASLVKKEKEPSRQERLEVLRAELLTAAGVPPPTENETRLQAQAHADLLCQRSTHRPLRVLVAALAHAPPPAAPLHVRLWVPPEAPLCTAPVSPTAAQLAWDEQLTLAVPQEGVAEGPPSSTLFVSVLENAGDVLYEGEVDLAPLVRDFPIPIDVPLLPAGSGTGYLSGTAPSLHVVLTAVGFGLSLGPQGPCAGLADAAR
eukprot:EG_transcript_18358